MDIESQVSNLTYESVLFLLGYDVPYQGDYQHLHYEGLSEVSLSAFIFEDPVNVKEHGFLAQNLPPIFTKLNDLHALSLKCHLI